MTEQPSFQTAADAAHREVLRAYDEPEGDPHEIYSDTAAAARASRREVQSVEWAWMASRVTYGGRYRGELCSHRQWHTVTKMRSTGRIPRDDPDPTSEKPRRVAGPDHPLLLIRSYRVEFADAVTGSPLGAIETVKAIEPSEAALIAADVLGVDGPQYGLAQLLHQQAPRALTTWRRWSWEFSYGSIDAEVTALDDPPPASG